MNEKLNVGREVLVRNSDSEEWKPRIFLFEHNGEFHCLQPHSKDALICGSGYFYKAATWSQIKELPEPVKIPYTQEIFPCWAIWIRAINDESRYDKKVTKNAKRYG